MGPRLGDLVGALFPRNRALARVEELDRLNVYNAGMLAMRRAVESLPVTPEHLLVDARKISGSLIPQSSLAKGDRISGWRGCKWQKEGVINCASTGARGQPKWIPAQKLNLKP